MAAGLTGHAMQTGRPAPGRAWRASGPSSSCRRRSLGSPRCATAKGVLAAAMAVVALVLMAPAVGSAQTVTGRVTDDDGAPVRGALVRLLDDEGSARAGVLSNEEGWYVLRAPAAGPYRLSAQRIGLASAVTEVLELEAGGSYQRSFELRAAPIALEGIVATGRQRCDLRVGEGTVLLRLWDEARKAFEVVAHTRDASLVRLRMRRYERELDPESGVVLDGRERARVGYWSGSPFVALDPETLLKEGFVQPEADGSVAFYLPDVDVLLSDVFHDAHCFRLVPEDGGVVGIAIEPDRGREGIHGTLWLDRTTQELRRLDYSLTHRTLRARGTPPATGTIEFEGLESGAWIVRRWTIRMPLMAERVVSGQGRSQSRMEVHRIREEGGEVFEVAAPASRPEGPSRRP